MPKLKVIIDTTKEGYTITVPGLVLEHKCPLHQSKEANEQAICLLLEAIKELREFKVI